MSKRILSLPHKVCEGTCYVNGVEDVLAWKGRNYIDHLLSVVGGMASFSYLKFKRAKPPNMVFWGTNPKYFIPNLERIVGFKQAIVEGRSFQTTFSKLRASIDEGKPVMAGALDMYYLHYYPRLYKKQHVPIHYILVVGYDDEKQAVLVHDCSTTDAEQIPYNELEKSLDVKVPGMSKRNTLRVFDLPQTIPSEREVATKGFQLKADQMLNPPVRLFGIPAMRKLSQEILLWEDSESFEHMARYATTPPETPRTFENSHGMRLFQATVLQTLADKYRVGTWAEASKHFAESGKLIIQLSEAVMNQEKQKAANLLTQIADVEEIAYKSIRHGPPAE